MSNHVTHKITFAAVESPEIFSAVCPNGKFDFEILVPRHPNIYEGDLSAEDEKDFPINWRSWNIENWGTKWNCYDQSCGVENGKAFIKFDTAWSIPYPVIAAFANKFNTPFDHRYYDEGHNFWGIETWGADAHNSTTHRISKRKNNPEDDKALCIELKGYDPDADDED